MLKMNYPKRHIIQEFSLNKYNYIYELVKLVNRNNICKHSDNLQRKYRRMFKNTFWVTCLQYDRNLINFSNYQSNYDKKNCSRLWS